MPKVFEDYFSELQANMVAVCLDYVKHKANDIYIYCSYEPNMYAFDFFHNINGIILEKHQVNEMNSSNYIFDISQERQFKAMDIGIDNLKKIHKTCKKFNWDMPTEIKLHYNVKQNRLKAKYKYELIYSNDETLLPDDVFNQWIEEVKNKIEG